VEIIKRDLPWPQALIYRLFGSYVWARRWIGGQWEGWIEHYPVYAIKWIPVHVWSTKQTHRPFCTLPSPPLTEHWKRGRGVTASAWCSACSADIHTIGDVTSSEYDTGVIQFKCHWCGHVSKWLYGPPCPILLEG
jgi:hypothetical protein